MQEDRGAIDLWCVFLDDIPDPSLLRQYRDLVSDDERRREPRFHFERDRHRYLTTRALVRTTLSRYAPVGPEAWTFTAGPYGRPQIANAHPDAATLSFNVAHTDGLIVLGVASGRTLGVDVENVRIRPAALDVAERFFSPAEVADLKRLPERLRHERFFDCWTLKEAYIKARGLGLSLPLDRFGFRFHGDDRVELFMSAGLDDVPSRWRFWQLQPGADYLIALCVERADRCDPALRIWRVVPLATRETATYPIRRTSR